MITSQLALAKSITIFLAKANSLIPLNPLAEANGNEYKSYYFQFYKRLILWYATPLYMDRFFHHGCESDLGFVSFALH